MTLKSQRQTQKASSSPSGKSIWAASSSSWFIAWIALASMKTSPGCNAGASTKVRLGSLKISIKIWIWILDKSSQKPNEGLFKLVVALSTDVVVLQVLLSVESDLLSLDFSVLHINFVSDQNNGNSLTDSHKVFVPLGHILVGDSRADIEHDNTAMSSDATR